MLLGASSVVAATPLVALIVPHAGYIYSGTTAAFAYACLKSTQKPIRKVAILGPAHFLPLEGLATPKSTAFETPLGLVEVDADAAEIAKAHACVVCDERPHEPEHSIEVQIPFLQRILKDFSILPFAVGTARAEEVAEVIEALWDRAGTMVLVSSDLSHYLPYARALEVDRETADQVVHLGPGLLSHEQACGATCINGLLVAARKRQLRAALLDLRNSGDTAGPKDRVVGYGAFAFYK